MSARKQFAFLFDFHRLFSWRVCVMTALGYIFQTACVCVSFIILRTGLMHRLVTCVLRRNIEKCFYMFFSRNLDNKLYSNHVFE